MKFAARLRFHKATSDGAMLEQPYKRMSLNYCPTIILLSSPKQFPLSDAHLICLIVLANR